jgi:hypothetical protein
MNRGEALASQFSSHRKEAAMPAKTKAELTAAQRNVLKNAAASLDRAYAEARRKVAAAGIRRNDEDSTFCLASPRGHCRSFKSPKHGFKCARPGCGHFFSKHNVF